MIISNHNVKYRGDFVSRSKEHTYDIISEHKNEDEVVMAGGDGTASTGLDAFIKNSMENKTFGIYPLGSGNDFAFNALEKKVRKVDVGYFNEDYFLNILGMGLVADVVEKAKSYGNMNSRYKLGAMSSLLRRFPSTKLSYLEINGEEIKTDDEYSMFMLMNTRKAGNGMLFNPEGSPYDGSFEFFALKKNYLNTLWLFLNISLGRPIHTGSKDVLYRKNVKDIRLKTYDPIPVQKDGEPLGHMNEVKAGFYKKMNMFRYFKED